MHSSRDTDLNPQPDFVVEYEMDLCDELKNAKPHQAMRINFLYEGDDPQMDGIHMIWPELLDENGVALRDALPGSAPVKGQAAMWIVSEDMREYHRKRLKVGAKGYWLSGSYKVANVTVIKLGGL